MMTRTKRCLGQVRTEMALRTDKQPNHKAVMTGDLVSETNKRSGGTTMEKAAPTSVTLIPPFCHHRRVPSARGGSGGVVTPRVTAERMNMETEPRKRRAATISQQER